MTLHRRPLSATWPPDRVAKLVALHATGASLMSLRKRLGGTVDAIKVKLDEMGLPYRVACRTHYYTAPVKLEPVRFPQFEDVAVPDADKHTGRRPQREYDESLTGCTAEWCTR